MDLRRIGNEISLSEQAYLIIKDAIVNNQLKPLTDLSEEMLAAQLGISRTPVRAAIKRLVFEKLVIMKPGKTAVVADISENDIHKVFAVRIGLEPIAANAAAVIITDRQIEFLEEIIDAQIEALRMGDYMLYIAKEYEFHTSIANYAENDMLYDFIDKVNIHVQRFLTLSLTLQKHSMIAIAEHQAIVKALKLHKSEAAEQAMRLHVVNVAERIIQRTVTEV